MAVHSNGNVFVVDSGNCRIRKITPGGVVTTVAGNGVNTFADAPSGPGTDASFKSQAGGVAVANDGTIIIADSGNNRIRKIVAIEDWTKSGSVGYTGATGRFVFDSPTGSVLYYNGASVTGDTGFSYTVDASGTNALTLDGHLLPANTLEYSIGSPSQRWKDSYIGPGSLNIAGPNGSSANLGTDQNGIIYAEKGFATPFINIGPTYNPLDSGAIGGFAIYPVGADGSGNISDASGNLLAGVDLRVQAKKTGAGLPAGLTGPTYSLLNGNTQYTPLPSVTMISSGFTHSTILGVSSYMIDLSTTTPVASSRWVISPDATLRAITFITPNTLPSNYYAYVKNNTNDDVVVYHAPYVGTISTINSANAPIYGDSKLHKLPNNGNNPFMYLYWDSSSNNLWMV
ncbi:MAG: hypothetical protein EBZ77_01115 [Chitinophagia bacterium]|nr:hypothetical protein [Chitinophagia bacterium]